MSFDCFNEDLAWILNKLVQRTGGAIGVISGQLPAESHPTLLASSTPEPSNGRLIPDLTGKATGAPLLAKEYRHDEPHILHGLLNLREVDETTRRYRLLHLVFSPAKGVKIVATVAKESRLGFKFLEDTTARRLYPVLSRYIRLWWVHRTERRNAIALRAVIDTSELGILLLNREGCVLYANSQASALLAANGGLTQHQQKLTATRHADLARFDAAVQQALRSNQMTSAPAGDTRVPAVLNLGRNAQKRDLIVTVLPVGAPALDAEDPAAIVYGLDPDQDVETVLAPVCAIYKLTATEARLAGQLVGGYTIADAARRINIQPQTARAYLKSIFSKTKTHRQAELVRVMLSSILRTSATR